MGSSVPRVTMWGQRAQGRVSLSLLLWGEHTVKCQSSHKALLLPPLHLHLFSVREKVCKKLSSRTRGWRDSQVMPQTAVEDGEMRHFRVFLNIFGVCMQPTKPEAEELLGDIAVLGMKHHERTLSN